MCDDRDASDDESEKEDPYWRPVREQWRRGAAALYTRRFSNFLFRRLVNNDHSPTALPTRYISKYPRGGLAQLAKRFKLKKQAIYGLANSNMTVDSPLFSFDNFLAILADWDITFDQVPLLASKNVLFLGGVQRAAWKVFEQRVTIEDIAALVSVAKLVASKQIEGGNMTQAKFEKVCLVAREFVSDYLSEFCEDLEGMPVAKSGLPDSKEKLRALHVTKGPVLQEIVAQLTRPSELAYHWIDLGELDLGHD